MSIVIDVGAHDGSKFSLPYSEDLTITVYAFEPNPALAEKLRSYNRPNLRVYNFALGEVEAVLPFYLNRDDYTSSLLLAKCEGAWQDFEHQLETIETIEVPVHRLDQFLQAEGITDVDLLKIDTQGFDFQVLIGTGDFLRSIRKIQLEVQLQPLYEGSYTKKDVVEYLSDRGFELIRSTLQTNGLEENLEFIRCNRYRVFQSDLTHFKVNVPYVGTLNMPKHDYVGQLLEQGLFEAKEQAFLWLYLREGDTFFDCGAHAGLFSAIAAHCVKQSGLIVGFEPNLDCIEHYVANLKYLNHDHFKALSIALSNEDGVEDLFLGKPGMSAFSSLAAAATGHSQISQEKIPVATRSLDSLMIELQINQVTLAKLDVEGWEGFVLEGAKQSIASGKFPIWMIEFTEENAIAAGSTTRKLRQQLENFGYTLCRFDATQLRLIPEQPKEEYLYDNLFAVMNLEAVNTRLATASFQATEIAMDLITRFDIAFERHSLLKQLSNLTTTYEHQYSQLQKSRAELEQSTIQLKVSQFHLQSLQSACAQLYEDIKMLNENIGLLHQEKEDLYQEINLLHQEKVALHQEKVALHQEKEDLHQEIEAMKTSKFWKLRTFWIHLKQNVGL